MLRLVLLLLMAYITSVILATCPEGPPRVIIDGHTVNRSFESEASLPLGTTVVLVCNVGIAEGVIYNTTWVCPDEQCIRKGYVGRKIGVNDKNETVLAINITSTRDNGKYTCIVTADECIGSGHFDLKVTGGEVVHSYGRLILNEGVISNKRQLQPPDSTKRTGRIELKCSVWNGSGKARFTHYGVNDTHTKVDEIEDEFDTTVVMKLTHPKKFAIEGICGNLYHYLFFEKDAYCRELNMYISITTSENSITVTVSTLPCGIARAIVGYARLVHGVWVEGEYVNLRECESKTFFSLAYFHNYRITVWGLSGGDTDNRRRCKSPTVRVYNLMPMATSRQRASPPRDVEVTGVGSEAQMYWIPPMYPNGNISHYKINRMHNGLKQEVNTTTNANHHTLTGMKRGESYNFTVMAVHKDGLEGNSSDTKSYVHNPKSDSK